MAKAENANTIPATTIAVSAGMELPPYINRELQESLKP
jgi:hypothetical protein